MLVNRKQTQSLFAIFFTFFIDYLGATIVFPIFAPLFLEPEQGLFLESMTHTARLTLLGLFLAVFPLMQLIFSPLVGDYADRHGRKRALVITTIVTMIGYAATGLCMQFGFIWLLFVARMVMGASSGNLSVCLTAISDVSSSKKKVVRYYALGSVIAGFTFVIGPIIGGKLSDPSVNARFFPALPLYIGAFLTLINVVFLIYCFFETIKKKSSKSFNFIKCISNLRIAFKTPSLKRLYAIFFFYLLSWNMVFQFVPAYLVERFSLHNSMIGNVLAFLGGCWIVGSLFFKFLYHKIPPKAILITSSVVFSALILLSINYGGIVRFSLIIGIAVFFSSFPWPLCTGEISDASPKEMQGKVMGLSQSVQSLAMMVAPLIAAPLMSAHYGLAFGMAALFSLVYPFLLFGVKFEK